MEKEGTDYKPLPLCWSNIMKKRSYLAIDLKSFYASAECVSRGLDPLDTNLLVADSERTDKTICLAVSPSLKSYGVAGRPRLFEVVEKVREVNYFRKKLAGGTFSASSVFASELKERKDLALDYIVARPRMSYYMEISGKVVEIYLDYVSIDDMHIYSVDEVFIDISDYLPFYKISAAELAKRMVRSVLLKTGITATVGIGTNLYLAKIAMDIVAKKKEADKDGIRLAYLDEKRYRALLWDHLPLTDFWQIGRGIAKSLAGQNLYTMRDIARCSIGGGDSYYNEDLLYQLFGVKAELLIDHAWGRESCLMEDIKNYRPDNKSISTGQVLARPYSCKEGEIIVNEMAESLVMDLMKKDLYTEKLVLTISYEHITDENKFSPSFNIKKDSYGRSVPKHARGTVNLDRRSRLLGPIKEKLLELYKKIINPALQIRKVNITACKLADRPSDSSNIKQLDLMNLLEERTDSYKGAESVSKEVLKKDGSLEEKSPVEKTNRQYNLQKAIYKLRQRYGKNAVLRGINLEEGATMIDRNRQIGGHRQ